MPQGSGNRVSFDAVKQLVRMREHGEKTDEFRYLAKKKKGSAKRPSPFSSD